MSPAMNDGIVRNAIAAFAIVVSLGTGGLKFYTDFLNSQRTIAELQQQMDALQMTVNAIYCKLEPGAINCKQIR